MRTDGWPAHHHPAPTNAQAAGSASRSPPPPLSSHPRHPPLPAPSPPGSPPPPWTFPRAQPQEIYVDDESKLTLHGLVQHYVMLHEDEKNRKLNDLLDALDFNQVRAGGVGGLRK
jgi:hypothetical protein